MKRIASIAFAFVIMLNTMGYYAVFVGLHYQNDMAMTEALDSDIYDPSKTITLTVSVSLPYMPDQPDFQRVNGQFEQNGELYRIVKQRYARDTLTIVCVRDTEHKKIDRALADYVKTFSDKESNSEPTSKLSVSFIKDYLPIFFQINSATEGWTLQVTHDPSIQNLIPTFSASIVHPPERA